METYQIEIIKAAFDRCFGLKELLTKDVRRGMHELCMQTGLRVIFINEHIEQIKAL